MTKSLGICLGASYIKIVELQKQNGTVLISNIIVEPHFGNPLAKYKELLKKIDLSDIKYAALTGRRFKEFIQTPTITEPEAIENALAFHQGTNRHHYQGIVSLGSENFVLYKLNKEGNIVDVRTGNKCASGTGAFFLQQIGRMNLSLEQALDNPLESEPYKVSGRCSVFCKSDCTHALNKGIPSKRVVHGLSLMIAEKVLELIGKMELRDFIAIGGVTQNHAVTTLLKRKVKNFHIPKEANYFEALGAACHALQNEVSAKSLDKILSGRSSFGFLPAIQKAESLVTFGQIEKGSPKENEECILGLDVGSTTTKAVIVSSGEKKILASIYLRTNGNPVQASRECYSGVLKQLDKPVRIIGLGVTGSGRYIAALHAQTKGIINEIISHATAAAFFDKEVDTIFEIGGQDAKYTYLINGVPADYAMNEACSAGTGSFLEEAALENLDVDYKDIAQGALTVDRAPNFSDQCSAFVSSDIKNASQENLSSNEILAGLVYSICFNYLNKVVMNRTVGKKIFMQGGVCYNKAVPLAMANILGKPIIVPPEPGLMGAFGVALEVKNKIEMGLLDPQEFDLQELSVRSFSYGKSFRCKGGAEKCDRNCEINMINVADKKIPFGGICDKYYNQGGKAEVSTGEKNQIKQRQKRLYRRDDKNKEKAISIGISKAFLTNTLFPLFYHFFNELGFKIVLPDNIDPEGIKRVSASFCFPAEIAHGYVMDLIKKGADYIFIPHIVELHVENSISYQKEYQCTCFLLQSEPYFIKSSFKEYQDKFLMPVLDFYRGWETQRHVFARMVKRFGINKNLAEKAFDQALLKQKEFFSFRKEQGKKALEYLEKNKESIGIVVFGRSYNSFADEANMGIPEKFSSRGHLVIPFDCLPFEGEDCTYKSCWASGQDILRASNFVSKHPQLFGTYVTNFSCGPDSFLVAYFRDIMKNKPSLTLELDSHTADAGINTRVEAFLDIVERYQKLNNPQIDEPDFVKAQTVFKKDKKVYFQTASGDEYPLTDPRVQVVFPSMGILGSEVLAACFCGLGVKAKALPVADSVVLSKGRKNTSCKECLPLILCCGSLVKYLEDRTDQNELTAFFMPTTSGNCRFGQYSVYLNRLIEKNRYENTALLTLTSENGYGGMGVLSSINLLKGAVVSDVMDDILNSLKVLACDKEEAKKIFDCEWKKIIRSFENNSKNLYQVLEEAAVRLSKIKLQAKLDDAKVVSILGEIFARRDDFSCGPLIERLNKRGIIAKKAPVLEWLHYVDYLIQNKLMGEKMGLPQYLEFKSKLLIQAYLERKIKKILVKSGLVHYELVNVEKLVEMG
ncbi:MAG: activase, partial [Candidatus Saganbacteria bacterium]|nr:activase [Candidatus Saganbacteria bacterium]